MSVGHGAGLFVAMPRHGRSRHPHQSQDRTNMSTVTPNPPSLLADRAGCSNRMGRMGWSSVSLNRRRLTVHHAGVVFDRLKRCPPIAAAESCPPAAAICLTQRRPLRSWNSGCGTFSMRSAAKGSKHRAHFREDKIPSVRSLVPVTAGSRDKRECHADCLSRAPADL
jgi:hypothetical protein